MNMHKVTEREFLEELTDLVGYALEKDDKNVLARAYGRIEEQLNAVKSDDYNPEAVKKAFDRGLEESVRRLGRFNTTDTRFTNT